MPPAKFPRSPTSQTMLPDQRNRGGEPFAQQPSGAIYDTLPGEHIKSAPTAAAIAMALKNFPGKPDALFRHWARLKSVQNTGTICNVSKMDTSGVAETGWKFAERRRRADQPAIQRRQHTIWPNSEHCAGRIRDNLNRREHLSRSQPAPAKNGCPATRYSSIVSSPGKM